MDSSRMESLTISTPGDPETTLDQNIHNLKSCLKQKRPVISEIQQIQVALPTNPENTREISGHVQRKSAGTSRAQPPPRRQPHVASSIKDSKTSKREKTRRRLGNSEDSDSDSDSNSARQGKEDETTIATRQKEVEDAASYENEPADREALEQEDRERMKLFQVLRNVALKWEDVSHVRRNHRREGGFRREQLLRRFWKKRDNVHAGLMRSSRNTAGPRQLNEALQKFHDHYDDSTKSDRLREEIKGWDSKRQDFLDEALYGDIEEKLREQSQKKKPAKTLEEIILRVESDLIDFFPVFDRPWRGWGLQPHERSNFDPANHERYFLRESLNSKVSSEQRLASILGEMYLEWWIELVQAPNGPRVGLREMITARLDSFYKTHRLSDELSRVRSFLIEPYLERLSSGISHALELALESGVSPEASIHQFPDHLDVIQIIKESRVNGSLTRDYMDWISSDLSAEDIESICEAWKITLRTDTCNTYRKTMASIVDIRQEFCLGVREPGVVSLILLKGGYPATVKDVSAEELENMGWFKHENGGYWRYEYESAYWRGTKSGEMAIFRVTMEGEVQGMQSLNGDWVHWGDREDTQEESFHSLPRQL
ncbi:hypothetical protein CABS01_05568 [Colletotrichum abscissum]|uniref:Uncharacterized protein n=1 Tax=Colletotrichum abscissum TaxID=1671311 RepID=A0A9P9X3L6_9PEZI|nr:uncharacterized protein CABS01_05568 [Colletotrichum abscissum]KAI3534328.1 hypothetical protein CABS02_13284 [Colletotrichum abscissum]KAK1521063.1 hypothetical protein CABS01_05568 [Colletotrichum abscissum]